MKFFQAASQLPRRKKTHKNAMRASSALQTPPPIPSFIFWPALQMSFSFVAFPCLVLQYMGQAAYLIHHPETYSNAFWSAVPSPIFWPMFVIGTLAAIVASQVGPKLLHSIWIITPAWQFRMLVIWSFRHLHFLITRREVNLESECIPWTYKSCCYPLTQTPSNIPQKYLPLYESWQVSWVQALITGVFSITNQLMALACLPPLKVVHTSKSHHGQIFVPQVDFTYAEVEQQLSRMFWISASHASPHRRFKNAP